MKNLNSVIGLLVLSIISTACGTIADSKGLNQGNGTAYGSVATGSNPYYTASSACSTSTNVTGQGFNNTLSNQYRVCNSGTTGSIKVFPEDGSSKQVCIVPMKMTGTQTAAFAAYTYCTTVQATGTTINFNGLNANAVYVVDYTAYSRFSYCMQQSNAGMMSVSTCASQYNISANYGYGQF
jgi:hypothetical protein